MPQGEILHREFFKLSSHMLTVFSNGLLVRNRNMPWAKSKAYTKTNRWCEYQNVLYPATCLTDLGSKVDCRRAHFVASGNAMAINMTMAIPVATSFVAKICMYVGCWCPNPEANVCWKSTRSQPAILGKSQARCVPPWRITPTTIPHAINCNTKREKHVCVNYHMYRKAQVKTVLTTNVLDYLVEVYVVVKRDNWAQPTFLAKPSDCISRNREQNQSHVEL